MSFNKSTYKNYLANKKYGPTAAGTNKSSYFNEAIPKYSTRADIDNIITAGGMTPGKTDTNAQIVIGRDRWPEDTVPGKRETIHGSKSPNAKSGYSDYHGAGAIDMVVGRMAPYPLEVTGPPTGPKGTTGPGQISPLYTTCKTKVPSVTAETLANGDRHTGIMMDAARIYMSQMCEIDKYFKLKKADPLQANNQPGSAIMLKADRLRMHSRRDIYIHAGGDEEVEGHNIDSCGVTLTDKPKIHLMVGNGTLDDDGYVAQTEAVAMEATPMKGKKIQYETRRGELYSETFQISSPKATQHPVPRGENLVECLNSMLDIMKDSFEQINNFIIEQNQLNALIVNHVHGTAVGPTTQAPILQAKYISTAIEAMRGMVSAFSSVYANIPAIKFNYLDKSGYRYINSRYITIT